MNCEQCGEHILATTSISWRGDMFHPDCIGEAVARLKAAREKPIKDFANDGEAYEDEESFDDEYMDYEEAGELADYEGYDIQSDTIRVVIPAGAEETAAEVSDNVLEQIPAESGNGKKEIRINDIVNVGTLMAGKTAALVNREALRYLSVPETTDTFKPIPHFELVDTIINSLSYRRLVVVREEYAVSPDGMKMFGLLEINALLDGVRFAIGLRNSNDKSMRLGLVAGYKVVVCENMMFQGDFNPLLAKHTKGLDLIEAVSLGVDRIHRGFEPLKRSIQTKRLLRLTDDEARVLIYQAFLEEKFPISLIKNVHRNYFSPDWEDFRERTMWSLENAFTESFKDLNPLAQYQTTARLGRFISSLVEESLRQPAVSVGGDGQ